MQPPQQVVYTTQPPQQTGAHVVVVQQPQGAPVAVPPGQQVVYTQAPPQYAPAGVGTATVQVVQPQAQPVYVAASPQPLMNDALKLDLKNIALNQLNFFRQLNRHYPYLLMEETYNGKAGNNLQFWESMVVDYENYMSVIAEKGPPSSMPREIELVWRVHMLNPQCYIDDCMRQFGKVILHDCKDPNATYPAHNRSSFRANIMKKQGLQRTGFIMPDLVMTDAIKRQCKFVHKMIKINLWNTIYLDNIEGAINRYEQFMAAMWAPDKPQGLIMVPTNDIDLIWHSHQLDPTGYHSFCIQNSPNRQLVSHDDNIAPKVLTSNGTTTEAFWNGKYGANTYRGGRQFMEARGNAEYDKMVIYNPRPMWKTVPWVFTALATVLIICMFITNKYTGAFLVAAIALGISGWYIRKNRVGDLAEQKRMKRQHEARRRNKHAPPT